MPGDTDRKKNGTMSRRAVTAALVSGAITPVPIELLGNSSERVSYSPRIRVAASPAQFAHKRTWRMGDADESTHVLGNGVAMVHEVGPNIAYFRAPWVSSPNALRLILIGPPEIRTISSRELGTNIWHHKLYIRDDLVGEMVDFLEEDRPCLRRMISSSVGLTFSAQGPRWADYSDHYRDHGSTIGQWPNGSVILGGFRSWSPFTVQILFPKSTQFLIGDAADKPTCLGTSTYFDLQRYEARLQLAPGHNEISMAVEVDLAECLSVTDQVLARPTQESLTKARLFWKSRMANVRWIGSQERDDLPIDAVIDDVATLLLGSRSRAGSFSAGPIYPLFFVRDQYGVSRALLAVGLMEEAKSILEYYYSLWVAHGRIHNAQSDGPRIWFHRHENDNVEMTGYLIIQALDYLRATNDNEFIAHIFPMLDWALVAQEKQLRGNMLPFNGDETYIAGGILPRTHLNDGSSEATLLYLAAAERLLDWCDTHRSWSVEKLKQHKQILQSVKEEYGRNFVLNGRVIANNPVRRKLGESPRFRHGVCLGRYDEHCLLFGTTERAEDGRYFCYNCYPKRTRESFVPKTYFIPSIALLSNLIDYSVVSAELGAATLRGALAVYSQRGRFTWPDEPLPGYEMAILSLALLKGQHPRTSEFVHQMLKLRDATGSWVEYYKGGIPYGCRCRPWESSLSLLALLNYAARRKG